MKISGKIKTLTGLHIGGYKDFFGIGGVDTPVIKDKKGYPYIPGSSLKGKIRALLEVKYGINAVAKWQSEANDEEKRQMEKKIAFVFGPSDSDKRETPIVVVFRDAHINKEFLQELENKAKDTDNNVRNLLYELKVENTVDRVTGTSSSGLRTIERVVPGVLFDVEFVVHDYLFENGKYEHESRWSITLKEVLELLKEGFELLESDYLGGSGTRGYGKIDVSEILESLEEKITAA